MNKRLKLIFAIIIIAVLVIPRGPVQRRDDGGTVEYIAITWRLENRKTLHRENGVDGYILGKRFCFIGICLYDGTYFVPNDQISQ